MQPTVCNGSVRSTFDTHWIFVWGSTDQDAEFEHYEADLHGPGWMGWLLPLRNELLRGDTRPLSIWAGWHARARVSSSPAIWSRPCPLDCAA